jgi:hypothetical protein
MKTLIKMSGFMLATLMILLFSQYSVLAAGEPANNSSALTFNQVIGGLAIFSGYPAPGEKAGKHETR